MCPFCLVSKNNSVNYENISNFYLYKLLNLNSSIFWIVLKIIENCYVIIIN